MDVEGTVRISDWTDILINATGLCAGPVIYPQRDWYLQLGKSTNRVGTMFVYGAHVSKVWWDSDSEIKENIAAIEDPLQTILSLNGRTYTYLESFYDSMPPYDQSRYNDNQYGFIAEELQEVLPNLVYTDSGTTHSRVDYVSVIPILVEAIKEQQAIIVEMQGQLGSCCGGLLIGRSNTGVKNSGESNNFTSTQSTEKSDRAQLFQNAPNPFSEKTEIKCTIPSAGLNPMLIVSNLNGEQLRKYTINGTGQQSIIIDGGDLAAGSYYYTLIVDNKEVATKKMILVK